MRYRNFRKGLFMLAAFTMITMGFTREARCEGFDSMEEYIQFSNAQGSKSGYPRFSTEAEKQAYLGLKNSTQNQTQVTPQTNQATEKKVIKTCEHVYEDKIEVEPTCSEPGKLVCTCSKCGDSYSSEVEPTGIHDYESKITKEATCEADGEEKFTCKMCGDSYTEDIKAIGHNYEDKITKEPTCNVPGEHTFTCKNCGDIYTEEIVELGHDESDWVITKEAGIFTSGTKEIRCVRCMEVLKTEEISSKVGNWRKNLISKFR